MVGGNTQGVAETVPIAFPEKSIPRPCFNSRPSCDGRQAAGELKIYRDEDGEDISVYVADPHQELSFEAVLASNVADKEICEPITINGHNFLVTEWRVSESNDDVKKVSIKARSTDITAGSGYASNSSSGSGTPGTGGTGGNS